jgi:hypothetical protein
MSFQLPSRIANIYPAGVMYDRVADGAFASPLMAGSRLKRYLLGRGARKAKAGERGAVAM